jgi:hypothetical protein
MLSTLITRSMLRLSCSVPPLKFGPPEYALVPIRPLCSMFERKSSIARKRGSWNLSFTFEFFMTRWRAEACGVC